MEQKPISLSRMMKHPSAYLPVAMSIIAIALVVGALVSDWHNTGGIVRQEDEGAIAHIWQLLMAGQLPIMAFFAIKWLPRTRSLSLPVLGLQVGAALGALAPVYFLGL